MMRASSLPPLSRLLFLAAALAALAVLVVGDGVPPAQAQQTPTVLVSNIEQTRSLYFAHDAATLGQGFTTGSQSGGYTLGSIGLLLESTSTEAQRDTIRAELWSAATNGTPGSKLYDLTVPPHPITPAGTSSTNSARVDFVAPANTTLAASTKYFLVVYTAGTFEMRATRTASDNEDTSSQSGWSIDNSYYFIAQDTPSGATFSLSTTLTDVYAMSVNAPAQAEAADPAPGDLDTGFGTAGKVITAIGTGNDVARAVAIQDDGKIVAAGHSYGGPDNDDDFAVTRYNADGTLDTDFATGGKVTSNVLNDEVVYGVAIQSDGKIVVAGSSNNGDDDDLTLARYTTAGALDTSFGSDSSGWVITDAIQAGEEEVARAVAIDSNDNIVVAGISDNGSDDDFAVTRYTTAGALDTSFSSDGKVATAIGSDDDRAYAVAIQSDDKIVVAGDGSGDFALARYTTAGALDTSFGADGPDTGTDPDGHVTTAIGSGNDVARAMAIQSDGKIVVVGYSHNGTNDDFALARYTTVGALDTSFGTGGKVTTAIGSGADQAYAVAIQSDGKIVVAGYSHNGTNNDFAVARYTTAGALDTTFGTDGADSDSDPDGFVTIAIGSGNDVARAVAIASDGKIVVAGYSHNGTDNDFALARFHAGQVQQTSTVLVSNTDQAPGAFISTDGLIYMQGFTTGSHSAGYTLASIEAVIEASSVSAADRGTIRAELWSADTDGDPDAKVASLTVPASVATGTVSFAAPASTVLTASTKYFFTLYTTGSFDLKIDFTASDDEDTGSQAGWSISDSPHTSLTDTPSGATWTSVTGGNPEDTPALRLRFKGAAAEADPALDLSALTAESSTDNNTFASLTLNPEFAADTTAYRATVANDVTHVRLTPTLADTGSILQVGQMGSLASENSGSPSDAIALDVGDNDIAVHVSTSDFLSTRVYTVTVHRAPADTLVSNIGQISSEDDYASTDSYVIAQGFTTGANAGGYTLTSIEAFLVDDASAAESGKFRAELWSAATSGGPSAKVADLTVPSDMPQGVVSFAAPSNTALTASTTYYLVLYTIDTTELAVDLTEMEDEDAGGQAGWAIENKAYGQPREQPDANQAWAVYAPTDGLPKLRVRGAAAPPPDAIWSATLTAQDVGSGSYGCDDILAGTVNQAVCAPSGALTDDTFSYQGVDYNITGLAVFSNGLFRLILDSDIPQRLLESATLVVDGHGLPLSTGAVPSGQPDELRIENSGLSWSVGDTVQLWLVGPTGPDPGDLDTGFGAGGKVTTPIGNGGDRGYAVAEQPDGKIVVAGSSYNGSNRDFAVVRYNADGTLDTDFGTGGKVTTAIGNGDDEAYALAIQDDGKIVVAGEAGNGANRDFAVARYNADGTVDTTFGTVSGQTRTGKLITTFGSGGDHARAVAIDSNDNIVVAGWAEISGQQTDFALARYTSAGDLDTGFDTDGKVNTRFGSTNNARQEARAMIIQSDGKIVVAGNGGNGSDQDFLVARYTANGALDTSFNTNGWTLTAVGSSVSDAAYGVAVDANGNIVLAGETGSTGSLDVAVVRYTSAGALDTTFDSDGKVTTPIGSAGERGRAVRIDANGKIVVAGYSYNGTDQDFAVLRYNTDGTLDTTFGQDGMDTGDDPDGYVTTAIRTGNNAGDDEAHDMTLDSSGNILLAGFSVASGNADIALARYYSGQVQQPTTVNLSALTAESTDDGNTWTALPLSPAFDTAITAYTATVGNDVTHVRLTATTADGTRVGVGAGSSTQSYDSGTPSHPIALQVGDNEITAGSRAVGFREYTVTITRQAPQDAFLVSNAGQMDATASWITDAWSVAQAFTTGAFSGGYTLESIDAVIRATGITQAQRDTIRAELWSSATGGAPGQKIIDLAVPAHPIATGTVSFTAPANTNLAASVTYYAVFYTVGAFDMRLGRTASSGEDAGSAVGWSIADGIRNVQDDAPTSSSSWTSRLSPVKITVNGSEGQTATPTVTASLGVMPNPVPEGDAVTVTVSLDRPLTSDVTIPLVITDDTADPTDHGALAGVVVPANAFSGTGTITTVRDDDGKDETFTVALGSLPAGVQADVNGSSVTVTIADEAGATLLACPEAGRVWLADMTAGRETVSGGTVRTGYPSGTGTISTRGFMFQETYYRISSVTFNTNSNVPASNNKLVITLDRGWTSDMLARLALSVDGALFHLSESIRPQGATSATRVWDAPLNWEEGRRVRLCLSESLVSLSLDRYRVPEGEDVVVKATLSRPVSADVTVPTFIREDWSNSGDHGPAPTITIPAGETVARGTITTSQDDDGNHERFRVALSRDRVPSSVRLGRPDSAPVTIVDDEWRTPVTVIVSASPNPVHEGSPVTVTAALRIGEDPAVLSYDVYVPLRVSRGSSEEGDHGTLSGITILAGERSGTGTIWTQRDGDGDDESFAVSMGGLPPGSPQMGCPNVVWVTISERASPPAPDGRDPRDGCPGGVPPEPVGGSGQQNAAPAQDPTAVTLALGNGSEAAAARTVGEDAGNVTLTATLDVPAPPGGITLRLFAGPDDTAARDADYTMPDTIVIRDGEWSGTATIAVTDDALDEADETANITAFAALFDGDLTGTAVLTITDDDSTTPGQQEQEQTTQQKYASLIAKIKEWRNDPRYVHDKAHTDRWDRTLLTFGETVADTTLEPMTADEAQTYADRGWTRWVEVTEALRELENQAPTVSSSIADATIVNESGTEQVSLSGVFDDPDNDTLTITAGSSAETVATVSVASDYSSLTVTAKSRGTATITVTASDGRGGTVDDAFNVTVKAAPEVASPIGDVSGMEVFAAQEISLSGVFSDADGDSLTLSASSSDDMVVEATLVDEALTIFTLAEGTATITVTAQDSDGNTVSDAFDVSVGADQQQQQQQQEPPNQAPTVDSAISDATIVSESGTKQVSLSGMFDDTDGDALTVTAKSSAETVATVSVASDYSSLTVSAKARGTATITVTANDGNGGTVDDTFTVTVKAAPVVASPLTDVSMEEGGSQDIPLSGVFSDADGDALTLSAASSDEAIVSAFEFGGTLTIVAVSAGSATITVTAQDADGNTVSDAFDVSVGVAEQQDAPTVAASLAGVTVIAVGGEWEVSLSGVFEVADDDDLTITAASSDDAVATVSVAADQSTLKVTGIAGGEAAITVTAQDADGAQVSDALDVQVVKREEGSTQPTNIRIVAGDGALTVSWTVTSRDGVEDDEIKHALRWSQVSGVWANPRDPHGGGPEDGISVEGGVASYTITGLQNGVATGVFVRSFTGGSRSERSEQSSKWVRVKGEHTTPRAE